jgi:hypothetical protein
MKFPAKVSCKIWDKYKCDCTCACVHFQFMNIERILIIIQFLWQIFGIIRRIIINRNLFLPEYINISTDRFSSWCKSSGTDATFRTNTNQSKIYEVLSWHMQDTVNRPASVLKWRQPQTWSVTSRSASRTPPP